MAGCEPWTSGIGSDRSTNWATTTAHQMKFNCKIVSFKANKGSSHLFNNDLLGHNHCPAYHLFRAVNYNHKAFIRREPWSSGYGLQLMFKRSWVRIPAPYTGWTFFTLIRCKNCIFCLKHSKINEKEVHF